MIRFYDVCLRRGTRLLISGATFTIFRGDKVGITGANGTGKSSLLALVRGELQPEAGAFEMPPGTAVALVRETEAAEGEWLTSSERLEEATLRESEAASAQRPIGRR